MVRHKTVAAGSPCRPPETLEQQRAWRNSQARLARGWHPHSSEQLRVHARAPVRDGMVRLDWAGL